MSSVWVSVTSLPTYYKKERKKKDKKMFKSPSPYTHSIHTSLMSSNPSISWKVSFIWLPLKLVQRRLHVGQVLSSPVIDDGWILS